MHLLSDMFSKSRQFVELDEGDDEQSIPAWFTFKTPSALKSYCSKIRSRRPVFLVAFERLFPRLFYGWVIVFACGIGNQLVFFIFYHGADILSSQGWWCVAPAATFGVGVYVDYWLMDPGAPCLRTSLEGPSFGFCDFYLPFSV